MSDFDPTPDQIAAIEYPDSMVVIAKPGSGKTYVMSEKIRGILPDLPAHQGVIAISYTNKASNELKKRSTRNGINQKASFFGTIDKFCDGEIIIPFLSQMWGKPTEEITVLKIGNLDQAEQEQFSDIHSNQVNLSDLEEHLGTIKSYFAQGKLLLETNGALALYVLTNSEACQNYITARYTHVFIDEYQDSGLEQHELFLKLNELGLIAVAVGDADQSIFQFSGKDSQYLLGLAKEKDFKSFPVVYNHRCHPSIVNYSQRLLNENASLLEADELRVFNKSVQGSHDAVAHWIDQAMPILSEKFGIQKKCKFGVLVRAGYSGALVDSAMKTKHRLFTTHPLEEHFSLWARLFCQLLSYRFDTSVTAQEILESTSPFLSHAELLNVRRKIKKIRHVGQEDLSGLIIDVADILLPKGRSDEVIQLLEESSADGLEASFSPAHDDEVQVMTLHKAKGLEFEIVFHLDMYEWVLPSKRPGENNDFDNPVYPSWEQDINLHYVGITRAKEMCILCTSTKRGALDFNTKLPVERTGRPSEFLNYHGLNNLRRG